jgi:hypothetical protein
MNRTAVCALVVVASLVLGCASEPLPLYRPFSRRAGYSEVQVAPGRFQVTYQGTPGMSDGVAAEYAKVRAAELAHMAGKPYLRVVSLEMGSRAYTDYDPAWYTTDSYLDRDGHPHYHQRLLREASYDTYSVPVAILVVEMLDEPAADAFATSDLREQATHSGLLAPPPTEAKPATRRAVQ